MTTLRCPSDILFTSCWLFTKRRCTWPRNHLVPCVAKLVGSCIPIHACRGLPNPKCLFDPSGFRCASLAGDHFCTVPVDDVVLFHSMVSDGRLVSKHYSPYIGRLGFMCRLWRNPLLFGAPSSSDFPQCKNGGSSCQGSGRSTRFSPDLWHCPWMNQDIP